MRHSNEGADIPAALCFLFDALNNTMALLNATTFYEPLICTSDKLIRSPIPPWRASLIASLTVAIRERETNFAGIASALNKLALLEAYQGKHANALALCDGQIAFWRRVAGNKAGAETSARKRCLAYAIQPLINIVRLERWKNTLDGPVSLYRELAPEQRAAQGLLQLRHGIELSLGDLCNIDHEADYTELVNTVYWREYARLLLQSGCTEQLQSLLARGLSLPLSRFIRLVLMEILILHQARCGRYASAARLLAKIKITQASSYWLHFKALEMYLAVKSAAGNAALLIGEVMQAIRTGVHAQHNAYGLNLLFDITKVFRDLECDNEESELLELVERIAIDLNDEMIQFEAGDRLATLTGQSREALRQKFQHSSYALIRKRLGMAHTPTPDRSSETLVQAVNQLARENYMRCLELLDGVHLPAPDVLATA